MSHKHTIGICGTGQFANCFIPLFKNHPSVQELVLCDLNEQLCAQRAKAHGVSRMVTSFEHLLESDVDAIAIFTPRHQHAEYSIRALKAGKHVYCAVPAAQTLEELSELVAAVETTGRLYMMGETSYYYPAAIYCRHRFRAGHFGNFVYGEGEYMHDMAHGFYKAYRENGGENWRQRAGFPPMLYPTHSSSMLISVTGASLTQVSSLGYTDRHPDGIFKKGGNYWDNPFSNESAMFRTSDGGMFRINEFRRVGHGTGNCVRTSMFGTHGCFEQQSDSHVWTDINCKLFKLNDLLDCEIREIKEREDADQIDFHTEMAVIHPAQRLPDTFEGLPNGHFGSHQFLVDDFIRALDTGLLPPNHVWNAVRYTAPGLIAYQSSLREGEVMKIPNLGSPPKHSELLEPTLPTISEEGRIHIETTAPDLSNVEIGD